MAKRLGIEKKIEDDGFKIKIGTLNKEKPNSIYIESGVFITPFENKEQYKEDTDFMEKSINDNIKNFIKQNPLFEKNYICAVEIPYERIKKGKKSYLSLQCHFKQTKGINATELVDTTMALTPSLFKEIKKSISYSGFTINKTGKNDIYKEKIMA